MPEKGIQSAYGINEVRRRHTPTMAAVGESQIARFRLVIRGGLVLVMDLR